MKKSITFLALYIICNASIAQIAYHDAVDLKKYVQQSGSNLKFQALSGDTDGFIKILKKYVEPSVRNTIKNSKDLHGYFSASGNNFITVYLNSGGSISAIGDQDVPTANSNLGGIIGGINITRGIDELVKFLVKRTKQEMTRAFFEKFQAELDKSDELRLLFPHSKTVLNAIGDEIYLFPNYLNSLKEAFQKDLNIILSSLEKYIQFKFPNNSSITEPFSAGLFYTNQIKNGIHPANAVSNLSKRKTDVSKYNSENFRKFIYALKVFDIFSESLRSKDSEKYWVSTNSLNLLFNETTFNIYLGLLYQQHKDVQLGEDPQDTFGTYLNQINNRVQDFKDPITSFINKSDELHMTIKHFKKKKSQGVKIDSYFELFENSIKLLGEVKNLAKTVGISIDSDSMDTYLYVLDQINNIYIDINEKKYNALIMDVISLSNTLNFANEEFNKKVLKYGSFIANVAQAKNSDQVQAAIEAIALPVGSASIKRKSKSNIALNAYVGLSPSYEYNGDTDKYKFGFGVHAPIGIAFSKGLRKLKDGKYKEKGSSTWLLTLIDLCAITSYRFGDSETENIPEIKLENIFAPGLYYVHGFPNGPISIGLGGQLGPQLRKITDDSISLNSKVSFSFKLFLAVDIPLLNFYTKSR